MYLYSVHRGHLCHCLRVAVKEQLQIFVLYLHPVGLRDETQMARLVVDSFAS